jgi:hypothetical protein
MPQRAPKISKLLGVITLTALLLVAFGISGFTLAEQFDTPAGQAAPAAQQLVNVIRNGDFEENPTSDVAKYWQPYSNGEAHFGWYLEQWPEAVHSGDSAQLMEIFELETFKPNRVIAIYQTVDVVPNSAYSLTIHALMRTDAPEADRNQGEYSMAWGIDYSGEGKYYKVGDWVTMPLEEQLRLGSGGPPNDNAGLFYELITGTVLTHDSSELTLFIRGVKVEPTGTEVNFNVDDVSLIGPYPPPPPPPQPAVVEQPAPLVPVTGLFAPPEQEANLPHAGGVLPRQISTGVILLGGLVLLAGGAGAVRELLKRRKKRL